MGGKTARRCQICRGVIKQNLPFTTCACGWTFHEACAKRTGVCPNCGRLITNLSIPKKQ